MTPTWLDPKFAEGKNESIKTMFSNDWTKLHQPIVHLDLIIVGSDRVRVGSLRVSGQKILTHVGSGLGWVGLVHIFVCNKFLGWISFFWILGQIFLPVPDPSLGQAGSGRGFFSGGWVGFIMSGGLWSDLSTSQVDVNGDSHQFSQPAEEPPKWEHHAALGTFWDTIPYIPAGTKRGSHWPGLCLKRAEMTGRERRHRSKRQYHCHLFQKECETGMIHWSIVFFTQKWSKWWRTLCFPEPFLLVFAWPSVWI